MITMRDLQRQHEIRVAGRTIRNAFRQFEAAKRNAEQAEREVRVAYRAMGYRAPDTYGYY